MKKKILSFLLTSPLFLHAEIYTAHASHTASSKEEACTHALLSAKRDALEQAGTLIFSTFHSTTSDNNGKINKENQDEIITTALGIAKLIQKKEQIKVTKEYQLVCNVDASFEIDQKELEKDLKEMVKEQQKQKELAGYFQAEGYSEEGQSRYRAFAAATTIAQRNLLETIQGSEITSLTKVENGSITTDKIAKLLNGSVRGAEVVKKVYDQNTRSAYVVLRIKKAIVAEKLEQEY